MELAVTMQSRKQMKILTHISIIVLLMAVQIKMELIYQP